MFKKILIVLGVAIVAFVIVAALQPADYKVVRTATISATPDVVFSHVNDLHKWQAWSPWEKVDPAMKRSYEGPAAGVGASYAWDGNNDVGAGRMTITESKPAERVVMKLEFFKPMEGTATAELTFKPEGKGTTMTWTMNGKKNFISKAVCLFMNMDKMVGGQFEEGFVNLQKVVAAPPAK